MLRLCQPPKLTSAHLNQAIGSCSPHWPDCYIEWIRMSLSSCSFLFPFFFFFFFLFTGLFSSPCFLGLFFVLLKWTDSGARWLLLLGASHQDPGRRRSSSVGSCWIQNTLPPPTPHVLWQDKGGSNGSSQVATAAGRDAVDHSWRVCAFRFFLWCSKWLFY